mgnify:CR=1 FL=1
MKKKKTGFYTMRSRDATDRGVQIPSQIKYRRIHTYLNNDRKMATFNIQYFIVILIFNCET